MPGTANKYISAETLHNMSLVLIFPILADNSVFILSALN